MPIEVQLSNVTKEIEKKIKTALIERGWSQTKLANLIGEGRVQTNRAVSGYNDPNSIRIRKKIYEVLGLKH